MLVERVVELNKFVAAAAAVNNRHLENSAVSAARRRRLRGSLRGVEESVLELFDVVAVAVSVAVAAAAFWAI